MNNLNHKYLDVYERIDDETISQKLKLYIGRRSKKFVLLVAPQYRGSSTFK